MLWPYVYLASEAGWCKAKKGFHFFSWNPSVLYIFSRPSRIIRVSILLTLYDIWQSPAETARHLTAVFSLLGHQRVYPWKLSWVFQPQVVLHHSVLLWTASQMQVRTLKQAHDVLTWTTMTGNPPTGTAWASSASPVSLTSGIQLIFTVNLSRWHLRFWMSYK